MSHEERQAFLQHIRESKNIVDSWPDWKKENSDNHGNESHASNSYQFSSENQQVSETES